MAFGRRRPIQPIDRAVLARDEAIGAGGDVDDDLSVAHHKDAGLMKPGTQRHYRQKSLMIVPGSFFLQNGVIAEKPVHGLSYRTSRISTTSLVYLAVNTASCFPSRDQA